MTEQELKELTETINKLAWINRALQYQIDLNKTMIDRFSERLKAHVKEQNKE